jgi:hypothetical protein
MSPSIRAIPALSLGEGNVPTTRRGRKGPRVDKALCVGRLYLLCGLCMDIGLVGIGIGYDCM